MARKLRYFPSPRALLAFEAAARSSSLTEAAKELNVSRVAVSRQVRQLELQLGFDLFSRGQSHVELTRSGKRLSHVISSAFRSIFDEIDMLTNASTENLISISTTPGVSTYWLMPIIGKYKRIRPNVHFRLLVVQEIINLAASDVDVAIRYGSGSWPGTVSTFLQPNWVSPLCSRAFLAMHGPFESLADLRRVPLLEYEVAVDPTSSWGAYFHHVGVSGGPPAAMSTCDSFVNFVQGVLDGQGVGLLGPPLMEQFLAAGILVPALEAPRVQQGSYFLCQPDGSTPSQSVREFRDWLLSELTPGEVEVTQGTSPEES
ncbi:LysR substrate-binding domain-containing protein [Mesorhizobium sp.]|uniref:LysR substrate-binding domain-containing protein n=1 Tax=Mesorhizobium sp. TaxID=1871066 RepID=UPI000FE7FB3A|nr:LysR substrate-binding domain-containing protein [Mesorhizobium sp.]RWP29680.1 MAG: LysR family transcriptional regulator [Mesorhizobium sp.]